MYSYKKYLLHLNKEIKISLLFKEIKNKPLRIICLSALIRRVLDFVCSKHNHTIIYYGIILYYIIYTHTHNTNDFDDVDDRNKYNNNYSNSKNDTDESKHFLGTGYGVRKWSTLGYQRTQCTCTTQFSNSTQASW